MNRGDAKILEGRRAGKSLKLMEKNLFPDSKRPVNSKQHK